MSEKKLAGIWVDQRKAVVVSNHDAFEMKDFAVTNTIKAEIPYGNSSENAFHNAQNADRIKFFKEIEKTLTNSTDVFITGPGVAQEELKHHLLDTAQYKNLNITLGTSTDSSPEVVLAEVKSHFKV